MTLADWLTRWPYGVVIRGEWFVVVPDSTCDRQLRASAWGLSDARVTSVCGGSIWFELAEKQPKPTTTNL